MPVTLTSALRWRADECYKIQGAQACTLKHTGACMQVLPVMAKLRMLLGLPGLALAAGDAFSTAA
jgi:hypothetical protein